MIDIENPGVHKFGDVATLLYSHDEILIPGVNTISIYFPNGSLPFKTEVELTQPDLQKAADFIRASDASMRSSIIQKGNDFKNGRNHDYREFMASNLQRVQINLPDGTSFVGLESQVEIVNLTHRMYRLPQGLRLFRLYQINIPSLEGDELHDVMDKEIRIFGEPGIDWVYAPGINSQGKKVDKGVFLKIGEDRKTIKPPQYRNESPTVIPQTRPKRFEIDALMMKIPRSSDPIFWVGETPHIRLDPGIDMVLDQNAYHSLEEHIDWRKVWEHVYSHLVDGGSDWPIRVEIYSPTKPRKISNYVLATFYRNNIPISQIQSRTHI